MSEHTNNDMPDNDAQDDAVASPGEASEQPMEGVVTQADDETGEAPEQATGAELDADADAVAEADEVSDEEAESEAAERPPTPNLKQILEGAILAAEKPLSIDHLVGLFEGDPPPRTEIKTALEAIAEDFEDRGFELKKVASGYRFQVRAEYARWVGRLWEEKPPRYTRALLETLALIAYKQPITRGDIEEIRGVSVSSNIMRTLLEREWIRIVGHRDVPGRPAIYATTKTFLDYFDLSSLDELPTLSEIKDLDKVNNELELDADLIEPRTLDLEAGDEEAEGGAEDDAVLDDVTNKVNEISENIKNLFREPEEDDLDLEDDLDEVEPGAEAGEAEAAPAADVIPSEDQESQESQESQEDQDDTDGEQEPGNRNE